MTKRKRVILIVLHFLFVIGIMIEVFLFILGRDTSPPADGDLKFVRLNMPEKENAGYYFDRAALVLDQSYQKNRKRLNPAGKDKNNAKNQDQVNEVQTLVENDQWKPNQIAWFIDENRAVSEDLDRGLACRYLQVAEVKSINDPLPQLGLLRNLGRFHSIRASYLFKMGKEKEALNEAMKTVKLGHFIEGGGGVPLYFLVGRSIKELGFQRFRQLVSKTTLPAEALKPYLLELDHYRVNLPGWRTIFQQEYGLMCKTVVDLVSGKLPEGNAGKDISPAPTDFKNSRLSHFFLVNHTKTLLAEACRIAIENGSRSYAARKPFVRYDPKTRLSKIILYYCSKNCVGKLLVGTLADSYDRIIQIKCVENVSVSGTQSLLAIRLYKNRTGKLPDSLGQLVPAYLKEIPVDDFDGLPVKYSAEKKVIYSVGSDLIDSGGIPDAKDRQKEIGYKIEF